MSDNTALTPARHEPTDVDARVMWLGVPLLAASVLALVLVVLWLFPNDRIDGALQQPLPHYPSPRLQVNPREEMAAFHASEMRRLNGVYWVDKRRGIVHIPIAEAMRKVAQEGIAGWPTPQQPQQQQPRP